MGVKQFALGAADARARQAPRYRYVMKSRCTSVGHLSALRPISVSLARYPPRLSLSLSLSVRCCVPGRFCQGSR